MGGPVSRIPGGINLATVLNVVCMHSSGECFMKLKKSSDMSYRINCDINRKAIQMTVNTVVKNILGVKEVVVESCEVSQNLRGEAVLTVQVHPYKRVQCTCPYCNNGKKLPRYDSRHNVSHWRAMDCGAGLLLEIECEVPRVTCPEHGVVTAAVPWALPESRFTRDFDLTVAWMAQYVNKSAVSAYMRISWETVGRCISRTREYLEPEVNSRLEGLVRIGIDETSYSKGRKYITTVVNHDTNTVVWVSEGHGEKVLERFFGDLTQEQKDSIKVVSGDGAKWITTCVERHCPDALRCTDPFHVVSWATEALDELRKEAWRDANNELKELRKAAKRGKGRPARDDKESQKLSMAKEKAREIKNSRYALGKAPENLTENQEAKLAMIQAKDGRLYRAYQLKETLRVILKIKDPLQAEVELKHWLAWAQRCRIPSFVELGRKIKRHKEYIMNFICTGISNARVEANNNKISLLIHRSFGFKNLTNMFDLIMLVCSDIVIPLPNRPATAGKPA